MKFDEGISVFLRPRGMRLASYTVLNVNLISMSMGTCAYDELRLAMQQLLQNWSDKRREDISADNKKYI